MARFYKTGQTRFIDYQTGSQTPATGVGVNSAFGDLTALPEDRARLEELVGQFEGEITNLATQLQQSPNRQKQLMPVIRQLSGRLRDEMQFGEIAAIQDRYKQYNELTGQIGKTFKDSPFLADQAKQRIKISDLNFDPITRDFGKINAPDVVKPFTIEDKRKFRETAENTIKDRILSQVKDRSKLNATTDLLTLGQEVGVDRDTVIDSIIGQISPEMIKAEQQELLFRGDEAGAKREGEFFDPKTRKFNLNTTLGRMANSLVESLSRRNFKGRDIQVKDDVAKARIEGNKQLRVAKGKAGIRKISDESQFIADKMVALYSGQEGAFQQETEQDRFDNWLQDTKTKDGNIIIGVRKPRGGQPVVGVQVMEDKEPKLDENGNPVIDYRVLDMDFIQNQMGAKTADEVKAALKDNYDPKNANINVDFTQDSEVTAPANRTKLNLSFDYYE